jgi:hypothetical protein
VVFRGCGLPRAAIPGKTVAIGHGTCAHLAFDPNEEHGMADEKRNDSNDAANPQPDQDRSGTQRGDNGEWLRDQVGEDHNLSGSSTYRTLPDQPEEGLKDEQGTKINERQSNR